MDVFGNTLVRQREEPACVESTQQRQKEKADSKAPRKCTTTIHHTKEDQSEKVGRLTRPIITRKEKGFIAKDTSGGLSPASQR